MKNSIWYRFLSEKDAHEITFDTIDISIRDIKKKIIQRRNMTKYPEKFDLIFYDEENPTIEIEDKDLVKPMKHLLVKRLPHYYSNGFTKIIKEPKDFNNRMNENAQRRGELQQIKRYKEPLEKISKFLKKELLLNKQFKCKICDKFEEEVYKNYIITKCCKETFCLNCYNKEEKCPFCQSQKIGYVKNEAEINIVKKLLDILKEEEEQERIQKEQASNQNNINKNNNLNANNDINQKNTDNINQNNNNYLNNNITNNQGTNQIQESLTSYQLCSQLLEGSQFFLIRSINVENIQKSKNNSVWATTPSNTPCLNQAFTKGKVILIFSASNIKKYQGYAIMTSYSAEKPSNLWQLENKIKLGGDFSVSWLCYCDLPFSKTEYLQINKSKDCTELDPKKGLNLCELCSEQEKEELERNPQRTKIEINEQYIKKIEECINNNKNKQKQKINNTNNNLHNSQQINNEQNKIALNNININNNGQKENPPQNTPFFYYPYGAKFFPVTYLTNQYAQLQTKFQEIKNPNNINQNTTTVTQPQIQQKKENEKKEEKKVKNRKNKRRSRSRDKSRSRSRKKNKSRSSRSRRSNSSSSRSEGRSKFSKSNK